PPRPSSSPPHNLALWLSSSPLPSSFPVTESEQRHSSSSEFRRSSGWSLPLHPFLLSSCSVLRLRQCLQRLLQQSARLHFLIFQHHLLCANGEAFFKPVFDLSFSYYAIHTAELSSDDTLFY
ncbi:hypothetical protein S245_052877, partial [Arachis hypogaea]